MVLELKMVPLDHKVALQPQKFPKLDKNVKNSPKNFTFCSTLVGDSTAITLAINHSISIGGARPHTGRAPLAHHLQFDGGCDREGVGLPNGSGRL